MMTVALRLAAIFFSRSIDATAWAYFGAFSKMDQKVNALARRPKA
jgi:hypothetical protein